MGQTSPMGARIKTPRCPRASPTLLSPLSLTIAFNSVLLPDDWGPMTATHWYATPAPANPAAAATRSAEAASNAPSPSTIWETEVEAGGMVDVRARAGVCIFCAVLRSNTRERWTESKWAVRTVFRLTHTKKNARRPLQRPPPAARAHTPQNFLFRACPLRRERGQRNKPLFFSPFSLFAGAAQQCSSSSRRRPASACSSC